MNKELENVAKNMLKTKLACCTDKQQLMFKRMYSPNNVDLEINKVIDNLHPEKIDLALTQANNTLEKADLASRVSVLEAQRDEWKAVAEWFADQESVYCCYDFDYKNIDCIDFREQRMSCNECWLEYVKEQVRSEKC